MKEEELNKVIKILEANSSEKDAFFMYDYEDDFIKDGFIHANKDGLVLFAKELLKGVEKFDEVRLNNEKEKSIYLEVSGWYFWMKKSPKPHIKPLFKSREILIEPKSTKQKIRERLSKFSYILFIAGIIFLVFAGFFNVLDWINE